MTPLAARGWQLFAPEAGVADWVAHALPAARRAVGDPANAGWMRCAGTWFAGVDVLPNDALGAVAGSPPLGGAGVAAALAGVGLSRVDWHRGQVSVVHPGYPRPMAGETDAAFAYRRNRDGAHVDGLLPVGPARRRMLREPHAFILGLALTGADAGAAPLVVWDNSHHVMRRALARALAGIAPVRWRNTDVTEAYHAARREVFETCARVTLQPAPGEAVVLHRLALHGIAPWADGAGAPAEGRMIAYFRPELPAARPAGEKA